MDLDLVQALHQTKARLDRDDDLADHGRDVSAAVAGLLAGYQEGRAGDPAYREEGADRIDRTGGGSTEQKERVQAALIAYGEAPGPDTAEHVTAAIRDLREAR